MSPGVSCSSAEKKKKIASNTKERGILLHHVALTYAFFLRKKRKMCSSDSNSCSNSNSFRISNRQSPLARETRARLRFVAAVFAALMDDMDDSVIEFGRILCGMESGARPAKDLKPVLKTLGLTLIDFSYVIRDLGVVMTDMVTLAADFDYELSCLYMILNYLKVQLKELIKLLKDTWYSIMKDDRKECENEDVLDSIGSTVNELYILLG
ncbi:unnamed protein product [Orchesella dallaii]|uniref:Uncharacterized protein n=1 Tax=Orchesella dallaii TaxID=48710 RepID=A0ABP1S721_9HEXA